MASQSSSASNAPAAASAAAAPAAPVVPAPPAARGQVIDSLKDAFLRDNNSVIMDLCHEAEQNRFDYSKTYKFQDAAARKTATDHLVETFRQTFKRDKKEIAHKIAKLKIMNVFLNKKRQYDRKQTGAVAPKRDVEEAEAEEKAVEEEEEEEEEEAPKRKQMQKSTKPVKSKASLAPAASAKNAEKTQKKKKQKK